MNKIETLPIKVRHENGVEYSITLYVSPFGDNLCLAYTNPNNGSDLLTVMIDKTISSDYLLHGDDASMASAIDINHAVDAMNELLKGVIGK